MTQIMFASKLPVQALITPLHPGNEIPETAHLSLDTRVAECTYHTTTCPLVQPKLLGQAANQGLHLKCFYTDLRHLKNLKARASLKKFSVCCWRLGTTSKLASCAAPEEENVDRKRNCGQKKLQNGKVEK
ncbi:hypothetical protein RRG08_019754 [Elysia crispata]|uniref:Uncharacterized protein n=1 Tax=Elysia crispata TaxID=231223 RepID=A0AAE1CU77_9GAST|nr:hypothetical protein RRG08_019754 [Elysia crispata]